MSVGTAQSAVVGGFGTCPGGFRASETVPAVLKYYLARQRRGKPLARDLLKKRQKSRRATQLRAGRLLPGFAMVVHGFNQAGGPANRTSAEGHDHSYSQAKRQQRMDEANANGEDQCGNADRAAQQMFDESLAGEGRNSQWIASLQDAQCVANASAGEILPEQHASAMEVGLDGFPGAAQGLGDLANAPLLYVAQNHNLAVVIGERLYSARQVDAQLQRRAMGEQKTVFYLGEVRRVSHDPSRQPRALPADDGEEPPREGRHGAQTADAAGDDPKRLLHGVLHVFRGAASVLRVATDIRLRQREERCDGHFIAASRCLQQIRVVVRSGHCFYFSGSLRPAIELIGQ